MNRGGSSGKISCSPRAHRKEAESEGGGSSEVEEAWKAEEAQKVEDVRKAEEDKVIREKAQKRQLEVHLSTSLIFVEN